MSDTSDATETPERPPARSRKQPAKRTRADDTKTPTRKRARPAAPRAEARETSGAGGDDEPARRSQDHQGPKGAQLAVLAAEQLVGLTGKEFEGIVGLSKSEDGWTVAIEVLELRRVPTTTDVIAVYEVDVDQDGELTGYRRQRRFLRGEAGDDR